MNRTIHHGRNVKRFREMLGIKQETFAHDMGDDWNQKRVSLLEAKEVIDNKMLEQVAALLKVPVEAIKNFDEEAAINIITGNFSDNASVVHHNSSTIHSAENELVKLEELKKLYEALIREKDERIGLLEKLIDKK